MTDCCTNGKDKVCTGCREGIHSLCRRTLKCAVTGRRNMCRCSAAAHGVGVEGRRAACECPPCPGRGNDGHGLTHCAECCFGTGVEADLDCPIHGNAAPKDGTP